MTHFYYFTFEILLPAAHLAKVTVGKCVALFVASVPALGKNTRLFASSLFCQCNDACQVSANVFDFMLEVQSLQSSERSVFPSLPDGDCVTCFHSECKLINNVSFLL